MHITIYIIYVCIYIIYISLLVHLNEGLVHIFDNLRGAVGLELEVVVDLGGALNVVGLEVHQQLVLDLVNEALGRTGGHQTVLNIITYYLLYILGAPKCPSKKFKLSLATSHLSQQIVN